MSLQKQPSEGHSHAARAQGNRLGQQGGALGVEPRRPFQKELQTSLFWGDISNVPRCL